MSKPRPFRRVISRAWRAASRARVCIPRILSAMTLESCGFSCRNSPSFSLNYRLHDTVYFLYTASLMLPISTTLV